MTSTSRQPGLTKTHPEWEAFTKIVQVPPLLGTPDHLRRSTKQPNPPIPDDISIEDQPVPGFEGYTNKVRIYKPKEQSTKGAVLIYVHGGGWAIGDLETEDAICRTLCQGNQIVVVSIDYRKAPENPFPTGVEDVWAGVLWVFDQLASLGGKPDKVIMGGMSAGGNFTAVLTQRALKTEHVRFRGHFLRFPCVVHPAAQPEGLSFTSYKENTEASILPSAAVSQFLEWYKPDPEDLRMSPLLAKDVSGLPPAYLQIAGADPLRDDGFAYAEKLKAAGVPIRTTVYAGLPHAFHIVPLEVSKKSDQELIEAVKWLLGDD